MAKIRVTKRPTQDFILKPNRVRMFLIYIILFALAIVLGTGIRWLLYRDTLTPGWWSNNGTIAVVIIVVGALLMSVTEYSRWTLRVVGGNTIEGPAGMFGSREALSIAAIDWERTRRSLSSWLKIGNAIYDVSRQRILVSPWFFTPREFREMLDLIGYRAG